MALPVQQLRKVVAQLGGGRELRRSGPKLFAFCDSQGRQVRWRLLALAKDKPALSVWAKMAVMDADVAALPSPGKPLKLRLSRHKPTQLLFRPPATISGDESDEGLGPVEWLTDEQLVHEMFREGPHGTWHAYPARSRLCWTSPYGRLDEYVALDCDGPCHILSLRQAAQASRRPAAKAVKGNGELPDLLQALCLLEKDAAGTHAPSTATSSRRAAAAAPSFPASSSAASAPQAPASLVPPEQQLAKEVDSPDHVSELGFFDQLDADSGLEFELEAELAAVMEDLAEVDVGDGPGVGMATAAALDTHELRQLGVPQAGLDVDDGSDGADHSDDGSAVAQAEVLPPPQMPPIPAPPTPALTMEQPGVQHGQHGRSADAHAAERAAVWEDETGRLYAGEVLLGSLSWVVSSHVRAAEERRAVHSRQ